MKIKGKPKSKNIVDKRAPEANKFLSIPLGNYKKIKTKVIKPKNGGGGRGW